MGGEREAEEPFQTGVIADAAAARPGPVPGGPEDEQTGTVCQAQERTLTFTDVICWGFYYLHCLSFLLPFKQQQSIQESGIWKQRCQAPEGF